MKSLKMTLLPFALLFVLFPAFSTAQNLVADSSFEVVTRHHCGITANSSQFDSLFVHWGSSSNNGDMFSQLVDTTCWNHCTNPNPAGPIPPKGTQAPRTGDVYVGVFLYTIATFEQREYVSTELTSPLIPGEAYEISAWVSLADFSEFATPNLDFRVGMLPVGGPASSAPNTQETAHTDLLSSTTNWMLLKDTLVADTAHRYLIIGNFHNDSSTVLVPNPGSGGGPGQYGSYYFIEDVTVRQVSFATGIESQKEIEEEMAFLPGMYRPTTGKKYAPQMPAGASIGSFSIYQANGQLVYNGKGNDAAWSGHSQSAGIFIWTLEWTDRFGIEHAQRGKVLVMD